MKGLFIKDVLVQKKQMIRSSLGTIAIAAFIISLVLGIYYGNFRNLLLKEGYLKEMRWNILFVLVLLFSHYLEELWLIV